MMGAPNLISDNLDCGLSYSVISYLKKLSQQVVLVKTNKQKPFALRSAFPYSLV